jgi:hypothetical protein
MTFSLGGVSIRTAGDYIADMDTPAHYATYREDGDAHIIGFISRTCPKSLAIPNKNGALPLHSMLAELSSFRLNLVAIRSVYSACPAAIKTEDNKGRLPLHYLLASSERGDYTLRHSMSAGDATSGFANCLRFVLKEYPDAVKFIQWSTSTDNWAEYVKRIILRIRPALSPRQFRRLNWQHRRMFIWLAYGTVSTNGQVHFILNLRNLATNGPFDMMREIVSYL